MKKDKKWLLEQLVYFKRAVGTPFDKFTRGLSSAYDNIEHSIIQLDEPKKVVIPQFVADFIMAVDGRFTLLEVGYDFHGNGLYEAPEVEEWLEESDANILRLQEAWVNDFEVGEPNEYLFELTASEDISVKAYSIEEAQSKADEIWNAKHAGRFGGASVTRLTKVGK